MKIRNAKPYYSELLNSGKREGRGLTVFPPAKAGLIPPALGWINERNETVTDGAISVNKIVTSEYH